LVVGEEIVLIKTKRFKNNKILLLDMVNILELMSRIQKHLRFNHQELVGLVLGILVTGFIFSFKDWGVDKFNLLVGLKNLVITVLAALVGYLAHLIPQKIYALGEGYLAEFKPWWPGIIIALVLGFVSAGNITLILAGGMFLSFMVRHRLGEFRYGYNLEQQAVTGFWGVYGLLIMATIFRIFTYYFPKVLFFEKGLLICLIFAICALLPIPGMNGLNLFFGSRMIYFFSLILVVVFSLLFWLGGGIGLVVAIVGQIMVGGYYLLAVGSEK